MASWHNRWDWYRLHKQGLLINDKHSEAGSQKGRVGHISWIFHHAEHGVPGRAFASTLDPRSPLHATHIAQVAERANLTVRKAKPRRGALKTQVTRR